MVIRQRIWAVWAALAVSNTLFASTIVTPSAAFRQVYPLARNGRLTIQNLYGNVSISAWDRDAVLVEAIEHSSDSRRPADTHIVVEPASGSLSIRTRYAGSDARHPTNVEFRLTVPRAIHLENVVLTNGQLSLSGLSGPVKASAVNGDIHALKLGGQVELSTVNGKVDAAFDRTSPKNPISLSSVNGAIHLTLPSLEGADVEATNLSGGIASDVGRESHTGAGHHLIVKGAGPQIHLRNVNGGISIHSSERSCT